MWYVYIIGVWEVAEGVATMVFAAALTIFTEALFCATGSQIETGLQPTRKHGVV